MLYLLILALSFKGARQQARLWRLKDKHFLYTRRLLPSISIIAPAYNEAANIIESTNSLLNQRYPHFELIVVNDGSKDQTLNTLIDYFKLEKIDMIYRTRLKSRSLRGIYVNKNIPNLIVGEKVNGGKADSLNVGLNISSKEFFCGIDADSLLEPEALLRAVSVMIDSKEESIAGGGNICPVNGCIVEKGSLDEISLPKKFIARLQSLEYIRAFMSGRVGWAYINTLLIISGAFGIFNRERTIKTGGYLTKSGKYQKDTVGEDMELVVRLSRQMREQGIPYTVNYAFNANCWTEVPESWKVLHRQRDRWHRGLIDIILFHRKLIANPRYGRLGIVGMLYYFLF
jgi:cellulose synthase/poly-beta-1,6-N-acetylglucosamine synthase-like glycosyltransferase